MPTCGMAIVTRGMVYPPSRIDVVVCDSPTMQAVVEVRPAIRGTVPPPVVGPAGVPRATASTVRPQIRKTRGPEQQPPANEPKVVSSTDLRPVIRKAEEEE